mmetsp:Transcript_42935/g.115638  ORF Transcript_42935/g.115638 Transcript_42935/m.115638 type:complete len:463 (+) Transcript_42935:258-1646(+)
MAANMLRMIMGGKKKTINLTTDLGLQMLNGIPEDIDQEEFIEHARMEWIENGYDPDDFDLDNFTDYVVRRDVKKRKIKQRLEDLRGISHFEEKEYKMQRIVDRRITAGKVAKYTASAGVAVGTELYYAGVEVGKVLEPGVMRRARRRRHNLAKIAITEAEEERLKNVRIAKQVERMEWEALEEERSQARQKRIAEMAPSAQIMSDLTNATDDERKRREHEHFNERRKAQVQQFAADIEQAKMQAEKTKEAEMKKLREWRASHWSAKADELAVESMTRLSDRVEARETLNNEFIAADKSEAARREIDRGQDQVYGPALSSDTQYVDGESLGIFGTPMEPGEFMSAAGGDEPGVDDTEVDLFFCDGTDVVRGGCQRHTLPTGGGGSQGRAVCSTNRRVQEPQHRNGQPSHPPWPARSGAPADRRGAPLAWCYLGRPAAHRRDDQAGARGAHAQEPGDRAQAANA